MPYETNEQVREKVRGADKLSAERLRQFRHVFNSCWEKHRDEGRCHASAWAAVNRSAAERRSASRARQAGVGDLLRSLKKGKLFSLAKGRKWFGKLRREWDKVAELIAHMTAKGYAWYALSPLALEEVAGRIGIEFDDPDAYVHLSHALEEIHHFVEPLLHVVAASESSPRRRGRVAGMVLYHGSDRDLPVGEALRTPTGRSEMDVTSGGVVYLTEKPEQCSRYGTVYEVEVSDAVPYAEQRRRQGLERKKGRYTRGVWVALPEDTRIVGRVCEDGARRRRADVPEKYGHLDFTPPKAARDAARKVLRWKDEHGDEVKAMTRTGWTRARQLAGGKPLSPETVRRMANFRRHEKNSKIGPEHKGEPWRDNGYVAWLGWGGDEGIAWAERLADRMDEADSIKSSRRRAARLDEFEKRDVEVVARTALEMLEDHMRFELTVVGMEPWEMEEGRGWGAVDVKGGPVFKVQVPRKIVVDTKSLEERLRRDGLPFPLANLTGAGKELLSALRKELKGPFEMVVDVWPDDGAEDLLLPQRSSFYVYADFTGHVRRGRIEWDVEVRDRELRRVVDEATDSAREEWLEEQAEDDWDGVPEGRGWNASAGRGRRAAFRVVPPSRETIDEVGMWLKRTGIPASVRVNKTPKRSEGPST